MIEERAESVGFAALKQAVTEMSESYRVGRVVCTPEAYLVTRMPATYAAAWKVLRELRDMPVRNVLDIGAGTGAASLAAREFFPDATITMIERDAAWSGIAREWLADASMVTGDVVSMRALPAHDLVIAAYSLGELRESITARLWEAARVALVVIEPGTPSGFARVRGMRAELLAAGGHIAAPCPGGVACPMDGRDWCHFAARVERSSLHRRMKDAELGYEDEKYSYVAVTREPVEPAAARILRRPRHQPGFITLETCTPEGLRTERIGKRDRDRFRQARQASWGDPLS